MAMTRFEKAAAIVGLAIGFGGLLIAAYPYWAPPQAPPQVQTQLPARNEDDPEMKHLLKAVLAKLAQEGKSLEAPPSVGAPVSVVARSGRAPASRSPRPVQRTSTARAAPIATAPAKKVPAKTQCRTVTTTYAKDGVSYQEKVPYCRAADGTWIGRPASKESSSEALRAALQAMQT